MEEKRPTKQWFRPCWKKCMLQITIVKVLSLSTLVVVPLALLFLRPENPELMLSQNRMGLYKSRQERVRQVCRQYNVSQSSKKVPYFYGDIYVEHLNTDHFYLSRSADIAMCYIYKVASTTFGRAFLKLESNSSDLKQFTRRQTLKPNSLDELRCVEKHGFTFMFVRHPMERLLSGYIEKIFERPPHREQDKGVNKIRKALGREKDVGRLQMAFSQSLSLSKDNASDQMTATKELAENDEESMPIMMTFNAFLHKILSIGNDHDHGFPRHWASFWSTCSPCSVQYDVIGKLESPEDFRHVWTRSGLEKVGATMQERTSHIVSSDPGVIAKARADRLKKFYGDLPRALVLAVYGAYRLDFELFNYDINEFLETIGFEPL